MKCKTSDYGCIYHACMSDDCQKEVVLEQGANYGPGKCEGKDPEDDHAGNALEKLGYSFEIGV